MKHLNKQSQNFLTVDTQKTALTIRNGSEGGFFLIPSIGRLERESVRACPLGGGRETSGMNCKDAPRPPHTMLAGASGFAGRF